MSDYNFEFKKENNTYKWETPSLFKKIRIMFKRQYHSKDEFNNNYNGLYFVCLDDVIYVNNKPFPQFGYSNCWSLFSKNEYSFALFNIGFVNNKSDGKSIYLTIINFSVWVRW